MTTEDIELTFKRKKVSVYHRLYLDGMLLKDAIYTLSQYGENFGDDLRIVFEYDYDGLTDVNLVGTRDETDEEFEARKKKWLDNVEKRRLAAERKKKKAEEKEKNELAVKLALYQKLEKELVDTGVLER